jgi:transposase InsO family protein
VKAAEDLAPIVGVAQATRALGTARATLYRRRRPPVTRPPAHRPAAANRLAPQEREAALALLHAPEFLDLSPWTLFAHLLDLGRYVCSVSTFYRLLAANSEVRERRDQLRHQRHAVPRLHATGPNQVWSWDITKLRGPGPGDLFHLYVVLDIFSRYVVGWLVALEESARLAVSLFEETAARQGVAPGSITAHSDRGPAMRSRPLNEKLIELGIGWSFSRPRVSNDNPYSESNFKTLKYRPDFPERFGSLADARDHLGRFFTWYNEEHRHSGIGYLTPADVHTGRAAQVVAQRQRVLDAAFLARPGRFSRHGPRTLPMPQEAWINQPTPAVALPQAQH